MLPMLRFRPLIRCYRWGGRRLQTLLGREIGAAQDAAESWEIADMGPDRQSHVQGGALDGVSLHELMTQHRHELLGCHAEGEGVGVGKAFPLLVKLLDAHDRLSVQVHPSDQQAAERQLGGVGKTEAWSILAAEPGSKVWAGLRAGVTRERLESALTSGRTEDVLACLIEIPVGPGDFLSIPAGTVHALGEGVVLAEIQQASDITFRLFDWGRVDAEGRPRPLHLTDGLECVDFQAPPVRRINTSRVAAPADSNSPWTSQPLVANAYFEIIRHSCRRSDKPIPDSQLSIPTDSRLRILIGCAGASQVQRGEQSCELGFGDVLLIPALGEPVRIQSLRFDNDEQAAVLESRLPFPPGTAD